MTLKDDTIVIAGVKYKLTKRYICLPIDDKTGKLSDGPLLESDDKKTWAECEVIKE